MSKTYLAMLMGAAVLAMPAMASMTMVDDFESYTVGDSTVSDAFSAQNGPWTATSSGSNTAVEQEAGPNNYLSIGGGIEKGAYRDLGAYAVTNGGSGTYYFQVGTKSTSVDYSIGLSDAAIVDYWDDLEAYVNIKNDGVGGIGLGVRNGGSTVQVVTGLSPNTWYDIWLVVDNAADTYDVYYGIGLGANGIGSATLIANDFSFRNGAAANDLSTFGMYGYNSDNNAAEVDSIYTAIEDTPPLEQTEQLYLSGTGADDTVPWDFYCTGGQNSGFWTTIPVPSCWELQGFGTYNYGHDSSPASEQGLYRHSFMVPAEWLGQNVQLVFEGSMTDTEVKVNGVSAGPVHQGAFYQFRYNIGSLLNYGTSNLLEVTVSKRSSNFSVNSAERSADYWVFGGIFRPVLLEARPQQSLQRLAIDAQADGALTVDIYANGISESLTVYAWVEDGLGQQVGSTFSAPILSGETHTALAANISGATPWTMEAPVLYNLMVELRRGGEILHTMSERFGFRTVEVRPGDGLYLNDVKIRVKGINRHVFHPDYGRTSSRALSEEAVELIKGLNMNAIRMSHYPPDRHLLEVCDEQGLLVLDELAGWQTYYDTATAERLVQEMVERDVNHPSIILWDNGNEGGWNTAVDNDFALYDPQNRTVIHPGSQWGGNIAQGGIDTTHYPTYSTLLGKLSGPNLYMPTEFLHGLYDGGHGAGLQDFWDAMHSSPYGVGGFLWVFADEGVRRTDLGGLIDTDGNHAPDGLVGPYNEKEPSYYAVREIWSPVVLTEPEITSLWDGSIPVFNDYYFTDLNECAVNWELGSFPTLQDTTTGLVVNADGVITPSSIAPQTGGILQVPLPAGWFTNDALRLTAIDPDGRELREWTWSIRTQAEIALANLPAAPPAAATVSEDGSSITLTGGSVQVTISKSTGRITSLTENATVVALNNGPRIVSGSSTFTGISHSPSGSNQVVTATYSGNLNSVVYTMRGDGWMRIDYTLNITGDQSNIGMTFDYPENSVESMRWLGGGPEPVWKNRLAGTELGVWEKTANNPVPGQTYTTDPIFRGYHRDFRWGELVTTEARIRIIPETSGLFFRVLTPANGAAPQNTTFSMPAGQLSLLHGISPIGTKFHSAGSLGPMSSLNSGTGTYNGSFWLGFAAVDVDPRITNVGIVTPFSIEVNFNRSMSAAAFDPASYDIPGIVVHNVEAGEGNAVLLDIQPLEPNVSYTLNVALLEDSSGKLLVGDRAFGLLYQSQLELDLPMDSLNGGISPDVSGQDRDAAVNNATLGPAWRAQGLQFTGSASSRATVSLPAMSAFTVEAWVKLIDAASTWPRLISIADENVQLFFDYNIGTGYYGSVGLNVRGRGDWRSPAFSLPAFNTWFHVAVAYNSAEATPSIYLNGEPQAVSSYSSSSGTYGTGGTATIANRASDGARGLNGTVDDFRIQSRVRAPAEIAAAAAVPQTESFESWVAARGYPGSAPGDDADGNGEPELVDYLSDTPVGQTLPLGLLQFENGLMAYSFSVGKSVENILWAVETTTNLIDGTWAPIADGSIVPWHDLGTSIEYLAVPADTNAPNCFGRLGVTQQ